MALSGKQSEVVVTRNDTNMNMSSDSSVKKSSPEGDLDDVSPPEGDLNVDAQVISDRVDSVESSSSEGARTPSSTIESQ